MSFCDTRRTLISFVVKCLTFAVHFLFGKKMIREGGNVVFPEDPEIRPGITPNKSSLLMKPMLMKFRN